MARAEIDEQIKRLKKYLEHTRESWRGKLMPSSEHLAVEQVLALAYIARELSEPDDAPEKNQADNAKPKS
jgi:hypothetical protein